jgi:outer membrane receptor protein involved in Fe transport
MEKDHHIYRDADFFNVSDGNTEHQGIELEASWQFSSELELNLSATHAIHRYLHSRQINEIEIRGNDIDSAPRYFGNARVSWQPLDQTRFELEWQLMGDYFLDPQNQYSYPGHSLFNLRASHRVSDRFSVYGRLLNITDRGYATRADYTSFSGERFFPGRSRTLSFGVQWRW